MITQRLSKGIFFLILSVFIGVALASFDERDAGLFWHVRNLCGPIGSVLATFVVVSFGRYIGWFLPFTMALIAFVYFFNMSLSSVKGKIFALLGLVWSLSAFLAIFSSDEDVCGVVGTKTISFLRLLTGGVGSILVVVSALAISIVVIFYPWFSTLVRLISKVKIFEWIQRVFMRQEKAGRKKGTRKRKIAIADDGGDLGETTLDGETLETEEPFIPEPEVVRISEGGSGGSRVKNVRRRRERIIAKIPLPELSLLDPYDESELSYSRDELLMRSEIIERKLKDYGLDGKIREVKPGPVVTTFEFVPAPGVKISQIASRTDDIALALAARSIRIQAPIPGKGAVGIEVPNSEPRIVTLRELLEHYPVGQDGLWVALGKTVTGEPFFADVADMPHLLIAGATGSGKSVCINSIICSLLFHHSPETLRLILIDPKRLELITYNDIPHLLHPVVTDAKTTLKILRWLTSEMDRRYQVLASVGSKNIRSYNRKVTEEKLVSRETGEELKIMPYYLTIIDELADIMVAMGNEIYQPIQRLAQMARAVGIHLIFATQRPSVDVITGVIKANFPCRIAFQVISKTDSRTILDINGAEKLLGNGDMLYLPKNEPTPVRLQGAFISEQEAERVASYWRDSAQGKDIIDFKEEIQTEAIEGAEIDDELFEKAKELVIIHQQGSISLIQRRLRVGYARAARLIDMLEQAGVVGPYEGSKARRVLISREEYERTRET